MRASSRAASVAKRRSSVSSGSISPRRLVRAARQHALDHAPLEPRRAARLADEAVLAHGRDRLAERRIGRGRQSGLVDRARGSRRRAVSWISARRRATSGRSGQIGQRLLEHHDIARQQRAQDQTGGQLAALAQMPDQRRALRRRAVSAASVTVAFSQASLAMRCGAVLRRASRARPRNRPASRDSLATSAWRVAAGRSSRASSASRIAARWPKRSTMRSIENGAISALVILEQHQAGFGASRPRRWPRPPQRGSVGAARDRGLHGGAAGGDQIDQIGIDQQRRTLAARRSRPPADRRRAR